MDTSQSAAACPHSSTFVDEPWAFRTVWQVRCGLCDKLLTPERTSSAEAEADERDWHRIPTRLTISWREGVAGQSGYRVSAPEYGGGEVIDARWHDHSVSQLTEQLRAALVHLPIEQRAQSVALMARIDEREQAARAQTMPA